MPATTSPITAGWRSRRNAAPRTRAATLATTSTPRKEVANATADEGAHDLAADAADAGWMWGLDRFLGVARGSRASGAGSTLDLGEGEPVRLPCRLLGQPAPEALCRVFA